MKVAVFLAGCGRFDGSEVHESVLALLAIEEQGATWHAFAPDAEAPEYDHISGKKTGASRNMMHEAARIVRDRISPLSAFDLTEWNAVVVPGGTGVARNFSDWATKKDRATMRPDIAAALRSVHDAGKPIGFVCVAPHLAALLWPGALVTLGDDPDAMGHLKAAGARPFAAAVTEAVADESLKVASTPAYMYDASISEVRAGIQACVQATLAMA